jgi:hypothetical protein
MAGEFFEFDIREACRNRVNYLREAADMLKHNYPDVDVVEVSVVGPCFYKTVFRTTAPNPEDYKAVALAVARINQFIRDVLSRLKAYRWEVFEKESYAEGGDVYMSVTWLKKIRLPDRRYTTAMDIYELAFPHIKAERGEGAGLFEAPLAGAH